MKSVQIEGKVHGTEHHTHATFNAEGELRVRSTADVDPRPNPEMVIDREVLLKDGAAVTLSIWQRDGKSRYVDSAVVAIHVANGKNPMTPSNQVRWTLYAVDGPFRVPVGTGHVTGNAAGSVYFGGLVYGVASAPGLELEVVENGDPLNPPRVAGRVYLQRV